MKNSFLPKISSIILIYVTVFWSILTTENSLAGTKFKGYNFAAELYQHPDQGGHSVSLGGNFSPQISNLSNICWDRNWRNKCTKTANDTISSVYVHAGGCIVLWQHPHYRGRSTIIHGEDKVINLTPLGFNDTTSSVQWFSSESTQCK